MLFASSILATLLTLTSSAEAKPSSVERQLSKRGCTEKVGGAVMCTGRLIARGCKKGDNYIQVATHAHHFANTDPKLALVVGKPLPVVVGITNTGHVIDFMGVSQCLPRGVELTEVKVAVHSRGLDQRFNWGTLQFTPNGCPHEHDPSEGWNHDYEMQIGSQFVDQPSVHLHLSVRDIKVTREVLKEIKKVHAEIGL